MKLKNLFSLKALVVLGISFAFIPFFIGFSYAAFAMRDISAMNRNTNTEIFEQTKAIGLVLLKASDIERKARLFLLLSDPSIRQPYERESYENARLVFKNTLTQLLKLPIDNKIALLTNELAEKENLIYEEIISSDDSNILNFPVDDAFRGFRETSNTLAREIENNIDYKFKAINTNTEKLEQQHFFTSMLLLLLSIGFISLLLNIAGRAITQLNTAIYRLSIKDLDEPIVVTGPTDLSLLGTQLEWLRQQLQTYETSRILFLHNLRNEMQAPLESIHSSGELLSREALQHMNKTAQEVAEQLCIDTKKLETIYLLIVNYSKVLLRSTTNHKEIIDLQELLEQILDKNQAKILEKEIQVIKTIIPLELYGVKVEIQSIFEQLIDNALQFSPQRSSIRLKLARVGNHLTFEIEDEGIGIAPSQRCAAFEPFFRNQSLTNIENKPAPSLGLAIVREYTLRHQGKIEIIDSSPDQLGTRIILKIPIGKNLE